MHHHWGAGGGFHLTCRLTKRMFHETGIVTQAIRTQNMPGGIGAVVINHISAPGRFAENDVRWIGAIGADQGVIAVRRDSHFATLPNLMAALHADTACVPLGASGVVDSQDWHKAALCPAACRRIICAAPCRSRMGM